jgi:hypothetical protein
VLLLSAGTVANATSPISVTYESEAFGIQTSHSTFSVVGVENFDSLPTGFQSFTTDFGTSGAINGSYSGVQIIPADQYGGAGGSGQYAVTFSSSGYSLDLTSTIRGGVTYFGYWLSALDHGNQVSFYSHGHLLFTFAPQDVIDAVNAHANPGSYYGNPNAPFLGNDGGEPFIFLNFYADSGSFDRIVFAEVPQSGGYESDNHTVGRWLTKSGTPVPLNNSFVPEGGVPEPATWAMMLIGFGAVGFAARQRRQGLATVAA